jgi:peptide/nickel transport system substrate-binding protein
MKRIALGFLMLTLLAGCTPAATTTTSERGASAPAAKKHMTIAVREGGAVLWGSDADVTMELYSAGLIGFDGPGSTAAQLAEAVPSLENGFWKVLPDGRMETTFRIRPDARWHDGTPLTSEDVLFGAQIGKEYPELALNTNFGSAVYGLIEGITAVDDRTVTVAWKSPYAQADWMFSYQVAMPLPKHLLGAAYTNDKEGFSKLRYWSTEFMGSGPFAVREFVPQSHISLAAFDQYPLGRPKIDEIELRYIADANALVANILAGAVDLTLGTGLSLGQALQVRDSWRDGTSIHSTIFGAQIAAYPQFLNPDPALLANVQLRRALAYAVDRQEMVDTIMGGVGGPAPFLLPPTGPEAEAVQGSIQRYDYDPRRAAQMLDSLGLSKGGDGMYRDPAGQELLIPIWTGAGDDTGERTTYAMSEYWHRIGINAPPRILSESEGRDRATMPSRPAFQTSKLRTALDTRFTSPEVPTAERSFRGSNRSRYSNPELDDLVARYFVAVQKTERTNILRDAVKHIAENVVVIHLFYDVTPQLVNKRVQNVTPRTPSTQAFSPHLWDL